MLQTNQRKDPYRLASLNQQQGQGEAPQAARVTHGPTIPRPSSNLWTIHEVDEQRIIKYEAAFKGDIGQHE
jgi:hypothetical protein